VFLRKFDWRRNASAVSWTVILVFLGLAPLTLNTSASLPIDIMRNVFQIQEAGGNEVVLTTVSQDAYSVWPLITYLVHGASGLQRAFTPSSTVLIGPVTYLRLSQVLTLSAMLIVGAVLLATVVPAVSLAVDHSAREAGPWALTYLPEMGTVTWRCDSKFAGMREYALGFQSFSGGATERLTLRVGNRVAFARSIQPGQGVRLPHLDAAIQELALIQTTEPGTLRASLSVNFGPRPVSPSHCFPWLPPAVTLHVYPR